MDKTLSARGRSELPAALLCRQFDAPHLCEVRRRMPLSFRPGGVERPMYLADSTGRCNTI